MKHNRKQILQSIHYLAVLVYTMSTVYVILTFAVATPVTFPHHQSLALQGGGNIRSNNGPSQACEVTMEQKMFGDKQGQMRRQCGKKLLNRHAFMTYTAI